MIKKALTKLVHYGEEFYSSEKDEFKFHVLSNATILYFSMQVLLTLFIGALISYQLTKDTREFFNIVTVTYLAVPLVMFLLLIAFYILKNKTGNDFYLHIAYMLGCVYLSIMTIFMGLESGLQVYFFALLPLPIFVLRFSHQGRGFIISLFAVVMTFVTYLYIHSNPSVLPFPEEYEKPIQLVTLSTTCLSLLFSAFYLRKQNHNTDQMLILEKLNLESEKKKTEDLLDKVIPQLSEAEERYRLMVETSNDIIFTMNQDLDIITINKTVRSILGYNNLEMIGKNVKDLLFTSDIRQLAIARKDLKDNLQLLFNNKKALPMQLTFQKKFSNEPVDLILHFAKIDIREGDPLFLGKASHVPSDALAESLIEERKVFKIANFINITEVLSHRLTKNLQNRLGGDIIPLLKMCLREMLINAIEHGNLGISFKEKSEAQKNNNYLQFIHERQNNEKYSNKKVLVDYILSPKKVTYIICDEGNGFNHKEYAREYGEIANEEMKTHGRGLSIAYNFFDKINYNDKGNQVTLVKNFL